jgi:hypothetical protein
MGEDDGSHSGLADFEHEWRGVVRYGPHQSRENV